MKKLILLISVIFVVGLIGNTEATITVPNVFAPFTTISSSLVNGNFSTIAEAALNRHGDNVDGNITTNPTVTIDGAVIHNYLANNKVSALSTAADAVKSAGGITAGSGVVGIVGTDGRIPAISSTFFASLSGANLTGIPLAGLSVQTECAYTVLAKTANYSPNLCELVHITSGTLTITLPAASGATANSYKVGIKNDTSNVVTVARTGADTIDGATSFVTGGVQFESYDFVVNDAKNGWMIR